MYGGKSRTHLWVALGSLMGLGAAQPWGAGEAWAADFGGDCCADLEERIAELEATTARKGNTKVSLEVSGHVNEAILFWDDGGESNAYIVTNDNERTRFRFKGKAQIDADLEAGYQIEIGVRAANSKRVTQLDPVGSSSDVGFDLRDSYWYLKSKSLGRFSVGLQSTATDKITESNVTQTASFAKYSDVEDTGLGLILRSASNGRLTDSGITWRRLIGDAGDQPGEGERRFNAVKYVSPTFSGFAVSAAWGKDDYWDIALNYSGTHAGFKVAAGVGYGEITDGAQTQTVCAVQTRPGDIAARSDTSCAQFGGSVSVLHEASGLFVNFSAGQKSDEIIGDTVRFGGTGADNGQRFWAVQAGIEKAFFDLGKTTFYGEYYDYDGGGASRRTVGPGDALNPTGAGSWAVWGTGVNVIGAGLAQGIDSAAMIVYLSYRHVQGDLTLRQLNGAVASGAIADAPLDDLDLVMSGAIIKF